MAKKKAKAKNIVPTIPVVYKVYVVNHGDEFFFNRRPIRNDILKLLKRLGRIDDLYELTDDHLTIKDVVDIYKVKIEK
jgi:hypothetical protein